MRWLDVWVAHLRTTAGAVAFYESLLSPQERARASLFVLGSDRSRFVAAHGIARCILSDYLAVAPAAIAIDLTPLGKPFIAGVDLSFNISHSDRLFCCAVSRGRSVGVDIERVRPIDYLRVARFLEPEEQAEVRAADQRGEGRDTFFRVWTMKEALAKATGDGLRAGKGRAPRERGVWWLEQFRTGVRYVGAVAAEGAGGQLRFRRFAMPPAR